MKSYTDYLYFETPNRHDVINISEELAERVAKSKVQEGLCLVSAMHITAGVYVNDHEAGLIEDIDEWLDGIAPFTSRVARFEGAVAAP